MKNKNHSIKPIVYNIIFWCSTIVCVILTFWNWFFKFDRPETLNYVRIACLIGIGAFKGQYLIRLKDYIENIDYRVIKKLVSQNTHGKGHKVLGKPKGIIICCADAKTDKLCNFIDYEEELGSFLGSPADSKKYHAFIGLDNKDNVTIINTVSYSECCFSCGNGTNGSYDNAPNGHLQVAICEGDMQNVEYFSNAVFEAAIQYCAYICKTHGISYKNVISDKETFDLGYSSQYGAFDEWLCTNGKTMSDFRKLLKRRLKGL